MCAKQTTSLRRKIKLPSEPALFCALIALVAAVGAVHAQHDHGALEMSIRQTNGHVRIYYYAQANKRTVLQYLPVTNPSNVGTNLQNAAWVSFTSGQPPAGQAPVNPPVQIPWEIWDYSNTNRATNLSRIYRLKVT